MSKVGGEGALNFQAGMDLTPIKRDAEELKKILKDLSIASSGTIAPPTNGISAFKQAQLQMQGSLRDARLETERLKTEQQALRNELAQGRISQQNYRTEVARVAAEQAALKAATTGARNAQAAAAGSYKEAQSRLRDLGNEIRNTTGGFDNQTPAIKRKIREYNELNAKIKEFDAQMGNFQRNVGNYGSAFRNIGASLTQMAAGFLSGYAVIGGVSKIITSNAQISDSLADVRRTAQLTEAEADKLLTTFKGFDTRTGLKGLLDIAVIAGQLGIQKDQIAGFTRAIDQLAVVLSGEIPGGAEAVATALGKINGVFETQAREGTSVEESYNRTGSAILGLGQSGLATGEFLQDFTLRVAGVAKAANISLPTMLAYGSVLEEAGASAEVAGTAMTRLLGNLAGKRQQFYAVARLADANLTLEKFTNIINTDANEALQLFFKGLSSGNPSLTAFNDRLAGIGLIAGPGKNAVIALAQAQATLSEKIKMSNADYNDANKIAEQVALKNDNLAGSIDKLNKVFENATTSGNTGRFFKGIIDYIQVSLTEFTKLVNSGSWKEFWGRLSGGNAGNAIYDLTAAFNSTNKKTNDNQKFLYPTGGNQDKTEAKLQAAGATRFNAYLSNLKATKEQAEKALKEYQDKLKDGTLDKDDIAIPVSAYKENAEKAKTYYNDMLTLQKKFGFDKKKEEEKQKTNESGLGTKGNKGEAKAQESALKRQRTLQAEIDALTRKGVASKEAADQQEIVSVEEKYRKLREKAIAFNNAKDSRGNKVNLSGLNAAEAEEKQEIRYKAEAKVLKTSLDEQAKYYAEFEDLKTKIGEDKAKDRYANLIDVDRTYLESLEKQMEDLTNPGKAKGGSEDEAEANPFAMKLLNEQISAARIVEQKAQDDLLADFLSYQEKRKVLTEKYNKQMLLLGDDAESKALRTEQYQTELDALDDANAKKLDSFKALFEGVDRLSDKNARKVVSDAEDMLNALMASGKISQELAKEIRTLLGNTKREIAERMPERIINLANQIDRVAEAVSGVDEGFGKLLGTVGNVVGQVGNIKKGMLELKDAQGKGDVMGQLSAGLGIFGAGISIFSSITKLFDNSAKREEQAAYSRDLQNKQTEAINKALEKQISLINDAYGTDRLVKYREAQEQIRKDEELYQKQLASRYALTGNKVLDDAITRYNTTGNKDFLGLVKNLGDLDKFKLPTGLADLERLMDEGKLDEGTAKIVENLINADKAAKDLANNLKAETIGTSLDSIADDFIGALTDGTHDFGKSFEDTIRTSILNGFKGELIRKQLQAFYDQYAEATSDGNLTAQEIEALRKTYTDAAEKSRKELEDLEKLTGVSLQDGGKGSNTNSLTGSIKNITEETGTVIAGAMNGVLVGVNTGNSLLTEGNKVRFDAFAVAKANLEVQMQIQQNTLRTANNTDALAAMRDELVALNKKVGSGNAALAANGRI